MRTSSPISARNLEIDLKKYNLLVNELKEYSKFAPNLKIFKDPILSNKLKYLGKDIFSEEIKLINLHINDQKIGIISLDIPESDKLDTLMNIYWGVMSAVALGLNIFSPITDSQNNTPFTIYNASYENEKLLSKSGTDFYTPEAKLGFHSDGTVSKDSITLPDYIMLYNLWIAYQKPGSFYWVPTALWEEKEFYAEKIGVGKDYKIKITPIVYKNSESELHTVPIQEITTPIFSKDIYDAYRIFLNGKVIGTKDEENFNSELIEEMKSSISKNSKRYYVEQKARRLIFLGNSLGFHARDIFEEPIEGSKITRSFIRAVDSKGKVMKKLV